MLRVRPVLRVRPAPRVLEWERVAQEMRITSERVVRGGQAQDLALRELDGRVDRILEKRRWLYQRGHDAQEPAPAAATEDGR